MYSAHAFDLMKQHSMKMGEEQMFRFAHPSKSVGNSTPSSINIIHQNLLVAAFHAAECFVTSVHVDVLPMVQLPFAEAACSEKMANGKRWNTWIAPRWRCDIPYFLSILLLKRVLQNFALHTAMSIQVICARFWTTGDNTSVALCTSTRKTNRYCLAVLLGRTRLEI